MTVSSSSLVVAIAAALAGCAAPAWKHDPSIVSCERRVCARVAGRPSADVLVVDIHSPEGTRLHNAALAQPGTSPCRGGLALSAVYAPGGLLAHGPMTLGGGWRLPMWFDPGQEPVAWYAPGPPPPVNGSLDLDLRTPDGALCLRVPLVRASGRAGAELHQ